MAAELLVLGRSGMLARAFRELLERRGVAHSIASRPELDLARRETIAACVPATTRVVINCAAYTDVDGAESDEGAATRINGEAVGWLAERCREVGATLVHFSTDYVFAGEADAPYAVNGPLAPLNAYGRGKALGETRIRETLDAHLIVRTSWLYAPWGQNFVRTMARLGADRDALRVVDDQRGRPTSVEHLASVTLALVEADARGTFHVTDGGECTWFEFATAIVNHVNPACRVEPCTSADFPRPAPRPAYSVLDLGPTEALVGAMPDWRENLADVLPRLED